MPSLLTYSESVLNPSNLLHLTDTMQQLKENLLPTMQRKERFLPPPAQNPTRTSAFSMGLLLCFIVIFKRILCKPSAGRRECGEFCRPSRLLHVRAGAGRIPGSQLISWPDSEMQAQLNPQGLRAHPRSGKSLSKVGLCLNRQEDRQKQCWSLLP